VATTLIARRSQANMAILGAHVSAYDPTTRSMLEGLRGSMMARGADLATATERAHAVLFGLVARQASMLAFVGVFRLLALIFLLMLPLLLIMSTPRHRRAGAPMH